MTPTVLCLVESLVLSYLITYLYGLVCRHVISNALSVDLLQCLTDAF